MKCFFLFIILCAFFPRLKCRKSHAFFVTRRDTKEAICISQNRDYNPPFPTFDLDKLQIPPNFGFKYWDWLGDWQLQNDTNVRPIEYTKVFIAGDEPFLLVGREYDPLAFVYILASNISVWVAHQNRPRGAGMLFEVDHWNVTTKLKDSTLKYCDQNPQIKNASCTILDYKNGTNHLNDGNRWTLFGINFINRTATAEMFQMSFGKQKSVVQWTWNNATAFSNPLYANENKCLFRTTLRNNLIQIRSTARKFDIFAKSHQRNAALLTDEPNKPPDLANIKEMKRNFTKRNSGKLCVWVLWNKKPLYDDSKCELLEVKNLASGRLEPATNTTYEVVFNTHQTYFRWNHLDAGEYEFTLRFDKRKPAIIELCRDFNLSNVTKTWSSIPKAITKCQVDVGDAEEFSTWPSFTPNPTKKLDWNLGDWEYVCDRLGIASNDTQVQIKFCNFYGCNFSKCPHLQNEPTHIFD